MKTVNIIAKEVQLMMNSEELGEAFASISLNPNVAWMKITLTDTEPNANKQRTPKDEFANIIRTGAFMPVKMAEGEISEGHEGALPLGSLAHLVDKGDRVVALAALWKKERPEDVEFLRNRYENGQSIDVSWELNYDVTASEKDEDGVLDLRNVEMNAVTIVGLPSYMGRTGVTALASNSEGDENDMDTIKREDHEKIISGLNEKIGELEDQLKTLADEKSALEASLEEKATEIEELETAKAELEEIKPEYEEMVAEREKVEKLDDIRKKFEEAGLEVNDEYLKEKEETLLSMEEASLDFFIQELVAFRSDSDDDGDGSASASISITSNLPDLHREEEGETSKDDVVEFLRDLDKPRVLSGLSPIYGREKGITLEELRDGN